ncbi:unnamed protein product, partial [Tetraodon nigroviridis]
LLVARLQTGEVLGHGRARVCDVQCSGDGPAPSGGRRTVNAMPNGKTPLHVACEMSDADCVALLLAHGAKVNSLSLSGHTPLHYCITARSVDCAKQLILKGLHVNAPSQNSSEDTPLHTAARFGIPELVALYLAHGASVDALNSQQETPLMTAAFWAFDSKEQTYSQDHHVVCRLLLDHRADPNLQEEDHKTALHKASWNCDHVLMQMLLEAGADARAMDINGCAPIQYLLKVTDAQAYGNSRALLPAASQPQRGAGLPSAVPQGATVLPRPPTGHRGHGQLLRTLEAHQEVEGRHS